MSARHGMLVLMRSVLASRNQELYSITVRDVADIADRLGSGHVEALSSSDGTYQFWVTPSLLGGRRLNAPATKMLFALTQFSAKQTPILRGDVVITSRTVTGDPDDLSDHQMRLLIESLQTIGRRPAFTIDRRLRRAARDDQRARNLAAEQHPWQVYFHAPAAGE